MRSRYAYDVFRRRTQSPAEDAAQTASPDQPKSTPAKGRPTPKRREAEGRRRHPVTAPANRKEAYRRVIELDRGSIIRDQSRGVYE